MLNYHLYVDVFFSLLYTIIHVTVLGRRSKIYDQHLHSVFGGFRHKPPGACRKFIREATSLFVADLCFGRPTHWCDWTLPAGPWYEPNHPGQRSNIQCVWFDIKWAFLHHVKFLCSPARTAMLFPSGILWRLKLWSTRSSPKPWQRRLRTRQSAALWWEQLALASWRCCLSRIRPLSFGKLLGFFHWL